MESFGGMIGSVIQMGAAKDATKAQVAAGDKQLALYDKIFNYSKDIQAPFVNSGTLANAVLQYELLGGDAPTVQVGGYQLGDTTYETREEAEKALKQATGRFNRFSNVRTPYGVNDGKEGHAGGRPIYASVGGQERVLGAQGYNNKFDPDRGIRAAGFDPRGAQITEVDPVKYGGFQKTNDYKFAFNEGQGAVTSSAAARGGLKSGATLKALTEYGQNFASLRRDNYLAQLAGMSGRGQASTNALQNAGQAYALGSSGALAAIGNAQAAGHIARGNYGSQAVQHGFQAVGQAGSMFGGGGFNTGGFGSIASQMLGGGGYGNPGSFAGGGSFPNMGFFG